MKEFQTFENNFFKNKKLFLSLLIVFSLINISKSIEKSNVNRKLEECYPNCKECSEPSTDSHHMKCLSCKDGFNFYKTNNCFNCSKYVNYEQTECIDEIPEGYYLSIPELGILGKCHELCKTCDGPPMPWGMQCIECKYEDQDFEPNYPTDCPCEPIETDPSGGECPRTEPILIRNDFCSMSYCTDEEYETGYCEINNEIIKMQWINRIERFGEGEIDNACLDYGENGELMIFGQQKDDNNNTWIYIYGIDKSFTPFFNDDITNKYSYFKKLLLPYNMTLENIKIVKNFENDNIFLISTQINNEMYVFDYNDNKTKVHKFDQKAYSSITSDLIIIKKLPEIYFTSFIICKNDDENNCYGYIRQFTFITNDNDISLIKEYTTKTKINLLRNFICIESHSNYIQCLYMESETNKFILGLYDFNTFIQKYSFELESEFNYSSVYFNSMIKLNNEAFVIAYSLDNNMIKVLIKYIDYNYFMFSFDLFDYIKEVPFIIINSDNMYKFEGSEAYRNSLCKINDDKFAMLLNSFNNLDINNYDNSEIIIYIFSIFNKNRNINVRKYSINFKLYNMVNKGKLMGYTIGNYFGILIDLSWLGNKNITNSGFITFGYIGTKDKYDYIIYDNDFFPEYSTVSNPLILKNYLGNKVENNLFGYNFDNAIILSLPKENIGNFYMGQHYKIQVNQVFRLSEEIFYELYDNYTGGNYSIEFAGAVQEPIYDDMNKYAEEIYYYPNDTDASEKYYYSPKMIVGKKIKYIFNIKDNPSQMDCYKSCFRCETNSTDDNNHMCTSCKQGYYFLDGTKNCYKDLKEHYYFDDNTKKYYPCYKDCLTCDKKETSIQNMNCLSCSSNFQYYPKTKNCLDCPNYVSYSQSQCISSIPEGYYLSNETLGTIEKCYNLCKTCTKGPINDSIIHMNCDTCLYQNKNFIPNEKGDCPSNEDIDEEVDPIEGNCPRDKPILKNNKCMSIYCSEKDFEDKVCEIKNEYIKKQWLNKINSFPKNAMKVKYDKTDNDDIFLISQKKEKDKIDILVYGFNKNKEGYFYDQVKDEYNSFKQISFNNKEYIEKLKYFKFDEKDYFFNIMKDDFAAYLINFNSIEYYTYQIPHIPTFIDKFEKNIDEKNEYLYDYIYCNNSQQTDFDKCYLGITKYKINSDNDFNIISNIEEIIRIKPNSKLICIHNIHSSNFILCKYNLFEVLDKNTFINKHVLTLFDSSSLYIVDQNILDNYFMPEKQVFDAMLPTDDSKSTFVIAYSTSQNIIKILFKKISEGYSDLVDLMPDIPNIYINEDLKYNFNGDVFNNDMCKLDENRFMLLIKTYKMNSNKEQINNGLLVISLRIENLGKVSLRYYEIDFNLYNTNLEGTLIGYNLNGLFGTLLEINSNINEMGDSAFLTFGFMNSTKDVSQEEGTMNLITNGKNIKIKDYINDIENNLFGYDIIGVQILDIPDPNTVGGFINLYDENKLIKKNDIINIQSELKFEKVNDPIYGKYSISFVGIIKEPSEEIALQFAIKTEYYPDNSTKEYYNPKTFKGKIFKYNFSIYEPVIKCFPNCEECILSSEDINNQHCLICKKNFYFIHNTRNCFDKIDSKYYFDEKTKEFYPCYKDCYTCDTKEVNDTYMNCLSCSNDFNYYIQSKNCLKCDKYVNYEQTQCIDTIPEGYYLKDPKLGIIDKCYKLCKTCSKKEIEVNGVLHMNCDTCIFTNNTKIMIEGNCPEREEKEDTTDEKKEDTTDEKKDDTTDNKKEDTTDEKSDSSDSNVLLYIGIGISIIIIIVAGIIIYMKCFKKKKIKIDPSLYFNTNEKTIPFDDDDGGEGIN